MQFALVILTGIQMIVGCALIVIWQVSAISKGRKERNKYSDREGTIEFLNRYFADETSGDKSS